MKDIQSWLTSILMFSKSNYYKKWESYLLKLLKISRSPEVLSSPEYCLGVQYTLLDRLSEIETMIQKQEKEYAMSKDDSNVVYNYCLRRIIKDIADGMAWRVLGYNRPLMRILSQGQSPGRLKTTISKEPQVAENILDKYNTHVLINDLTNILPHWRFNLYHMWLSKLFLN